jgi:hypothetical protein
MLAGSRQLTPNEWAYVKAMAKRQHLGARAGGIALVLLAIGIMTMAVVLGARGEDVPKKLLWLAIFSGLMGVRFLVRSRTQRGAQAVVTSIEGKYETVEDAVGRSSFATRRIGQTKVEFPGHWLKWMREGEKVRAELCFYPVSHPSESGERTVVGGSARLLSLNGLHGIDREVPLGLLRIGFPVSLVVMLFASMIGAVSAGIMMEQEHAADSISEKLVSGLIHATDLPRPQLGFGTVVVLAGLLAVILLVRGTYVLLRNRSILKRIDALYQWRERSHFSAGP